MRVPFADNACTVIPHSLKDEDALFLGDILATGWWGARIAEIDEGSTVAVIGAGPVGLTTMMCARLKNPEKLLLLISTIDVFVLLRNRDWQTKLSIHHMSRSKL